MAIDSAAVCTAAVRTEGLLPNATLVVGHFHLTQLANFALIKVRRRVTWELEDRRGGKVDPEWANRRRLLTGRECLSDKRFVKMWNAIVDEDQGGQILSAYIAKEELRTLHSTGAGRRGSATHAAPAAQLLELVHRLDPSRTAHPGQNRR